MSYFCQQYMILIENHLKTQSKPKPSKKFSLKPSKTNPEKLYQPKNHSQKPPIPQNAIKYFTQDQFHGKQQVYVNNNMFSDHFLLSNSQISIRPQFQSQKPKNHHFTQSQQSEVGNNFFSKKKFQIDTQIKQQDKFKDKIIKSVSSQKQSQRLEVIFQSSRKLNKIETMNLTQASNKKSNEVLKQIKVDEVSRTILRKSFCLQMIDDDDEWERVMTKSKKKRNEDDGWSSEFKEE